MSPLATFALTAAPTADAASWFTQEVQPHESALRAFLRSRFRDLPDVDDVVQEAYLRVIRAREKGHITNTKSFLFTTARNIALDLCRHQRVVPMEGLDDVVSSSVLDEKPNAAETTSHTQEIELLNEAIQTLPPRCQEILRLRRLHGLSHRAIAEKLNVAEGTINAQLAIGLERCRDYLLARGVFGRTPPPAK